MTSKYRNKKKLDKREMWHWCKNEIYRYKLCLRWCVGVRDIWRKESHNARQCPHSNNIHLRIFRLFCWSKGGGSSDISDSRYHFSLTRTNQRLLIAQQWCPFVAIISQIFPFCTHNNFLNIYIYIQILYYREAKYNYTAKWNSCHRATL